MISSTFGKIVIGGGGIIGNSIAYYLAKNHNTPCVIIDVAGKPAPAASGKAGGFLARDWSDFNPGLGPLQRLSFDLHSEIASHLGEDVIQYRRLTCAAVSVAPDDASIQQQKPKSKKLEGIVEWADLGNVKGGSSMGNEETIAQVHPKKLCEAMFGYAESTVGTKMVKGRIVEAVLKTNDDNNDKTTTKVVTGVKLEDGTVIDADALVVACGPWSYEAKSWFGGDDNRKKNNNIPDMFGTKYHSILIKSPRVLNQAVFFQGAGDPEVYPRPDGDAYITGFPDYPVVVTDRPGEERLMQDKVNELIDATKIVSSDLLGNIEPHTKQCCFLPTTQNGMPVIGKLIPNDVDGAFVASGHSCWGILNGPATGLAMADLLVTGASNKVDLRFFDPN